ncbi:MAG TPA: hypothetical protein VJT84_02930 [Gaiellaceae bacterium]|nr:hypothetical protein [Gaiellaceae bacterium]
MRSRRHLERELRAARSDARPEFVKTLAAAVRGRPAPAERTPFGRVGLALALTGLIVVALASFGGIGYASSAASQAVKKAKVVAVVKPTPVKRVQTPQVAKTSAVTKSAAEAQYGPFEPPPVPPPTDNGTPPTDNGGAPTDTSQPAAPPPPAPAPPPAASAAPATTPPAANPCPPSVNRVAAGHRTPAARRDDCPPAPAPAPAAKPAAKAKAKAKAAVKAKPQAKPKAKPKAKPAPKPTSGNAAAAKTQPAVQPAPAPQRAPAKVKPAQLPFTGLALWIPLAIGLLLVIVGVALRSRGRQRPASQ